jgi:hypothetical protein
VSFEQEANRIIRSKSAATAARRLYGLPFIG